MDLKQRTSLKGLLANMNKESAFKDFPKTQVPRSLTPSHLPVTVVGLLPNPDLKRKRKVQEVEAKQPKNAKDKRTPFVESHEESSGAKRVRTWASWLEMDGAPIPWDATI